MQSARGRFSEGLRRAMWVMGDIGGLIVAVGIGLVFWTEGFHESSAWYCSDCGMEERRETWMWGLFSRRTDEVTPLTAMLDSQGVNPAHVHHFLFANGGGGSLLGTYCAVGRGVRLMSLVRNEDDIKALSALYRFGPAGVGDAWRVRLMDPSIGPVAEWSDAWAEAKLADLQTKDAFDRWWKDHGSELATPGF